MSRQDEGISWFQSFAIFCFLLSIKYVIWKEAKQDEKTMKTNHRNGYVDPGYDRNNHSPKLTRVCELSGESIRTDIHPNGGHNSVQKCKRGAKRNLRVTERRKENDALRKWLDNDNDL